MHRGRPRALGTPAQLKAALGPDASLDDVFFRTRTGAGLDDAGSERGGLRSVPSTRRTARRVS